MFAGCALMVDGVSNTTQRLHVHMLVEEGGRSEWGRQKNWLPNFAGWSEHHWGMDQNNSAHREGDM